MNLTVIFDNLGPYHIARLEALAQHADLTAIELRGRSRDYGWAPVAEVPFRRVTLDKPTPGALCAALDRARPQVVFVPGWASAGALAALGWCRRNGVPAIVMSASQAIDHPRRGWRERVKGWILRQGSAAFVGGSPHRAYAIALGMEPGRIRMGYDAVDNDHFASGADQARQEAGALLAERGLNGPFVLTSTRFIAKKNLPRLIEAFAMAREGQAVPWSLVILGDGPLRPEIERRIRESGLEGAVILPGFLQYPDLPAWFGLAGFFVLASTSEQWGLVVNEAMAAGLPVLVSDRCGSAEDLVIAGRTGFTFDPLDTPALAQLMRRMMAMPDDEREAMGAAARERVADFSPQAFAANAMELAELVAHTPCRSVLAGRVVLPLLAALVVRRSGE